MLAFPLMREILVAVEHGEQAEIHRTHVERRHFGRGAFRRGEPLVDRHALPATGGYVDDSVSALLDPRQELHEEVGLGRRAAVLGVARMQMEDRRPGLAGIDRLFGDVGGRHRQVGRHGWRMDGPGDRTGKDDFRLGAHDGSLNSGGNLRDFGRFVKRQSASNPGIRRLAPQTVIYGASPASASGRLLLPRLGLNAMPLQWFRSVRKIIRPGPRPSASAARLSARG